MVDEKYRELFPDKPEPGVEKLLRPAIDLTYSDYDEGVRRLKLTINLLCMHIANIALLQWKEMIENDKESYIHYSDKYLAYEITSLMFTIYNDVLQEIPVMMQEQINAYVEKEIFKNE